MIKDIINEYGRTASPNFGDRSKTVGASEIGLCGRRIAFLKQGVPRDGQTPGPAVQKSPQKKRRDMRGSAQLLDSSWGAHLRGTVIERELWLPAMKKRFGSALKMAGQFQQTLKKGTLSATPDGVVVGRGAEILQALGIKTKDKADVVVECKSIDPRVNLTEEKEENAFQVQVQMGMIRELTPYRPDWAVISYVDASFWHEVAEFAVPFRPADFEAAQMRSAKILRADPADMRPEGWISGGKECGWCPWLKRCTEMRGGPPESEMRSVVQDPQFAAEIVDLCKQANALQLKAKKDTEAFKDLQDQIKTRLKEKGVRKIPGVVNWYGVKGRESYDIDSMIAELEKRKVDVEQFRTSGEPTNALSIDKKVALL